MEEILMIRPSRKFAFFLLFLFASALTGPAGLRGIAWAHGGEQHGAGKTSEHMAAMHRLKEKIPEEYRLMDRTPVTPTQKSLAQGKELYLKHCAACHGAGGKGDGPAAAGMNPPPANFLDLDHSATYGPDEKYWIISNGSPETGMPGFSDQMGLLDRWHLVNHILNLQKPTGKKK